LTAKALLTGLLTFLLSSPSSAQKIRIGVLGLFHPREITLSAVQEDALIVHAGGAEFVLEARSNKRSAHIQLADGGLLLELDGRFVPARTITAAGRNLNSVHFQLGIPGKIERNYQGTLEIRAIAGVVVPIVTMDLETAIASVVAAESARNTPLEALKAQAVVTRSYFVAGKGRHRNFDFCDLTHCQFLRDPPSAESPPAIASNATRGLVIAFEGKPIAAMFTRSCGGHTGTPGELGISPSNYPYYSVLCDACYKDPLRWTRRISEPEAALLLGKGEPGRLAVNRQMGWKRVPSNNYTARKKNGDIVLNGAGEGHGIGLCQRGASDMAERGATFREIVGHYFPNTTLTGVDPS
jgi:Stage II sporulation protein